MLNDFIYTVSAYRKGSYNFLYWNKERREYIATHIRITTPLSNYFELIHSKHGK